MASFNQDLYRCSFHNWMTQQQQDLDELVAAATTATEEEMGQLRDKMVRHFEEYAGRRAAMSRHDAPCFMSPPWCSAFENAFMWAGGCRPTLAIRLFYHVCGAELDEQLDAFLRGERKGNLAELSARQMEMINALHCRILKEEEKLESRIASLQEEIADEPLAAMAKSVGEWSREVESAMAAHEASMAVVLAEADRLRMETLKEVMGILTPLQAVDLLITTKKLHISMHCWGLRREQQQTST